MLDCGLRYIPPPASTVDGRGAGVGATPLLSGPEFPVPTARRRATSRRASPSGPMMVDFPRCRLIPGKSPVGRSDPYSLRPTEFANSL